MEMQRWLTGVVRKRRGNEHFIRKTRIETSETGQLTLAGNRTPPINRALGHLTI